MSFGWSLAWLIVAITVAIISAYFYIKDKKKK